MARQTYPTRGKPPSLSSQSHRLAHGDPAQYVAPPAARLHRPRWRMALPREKVASRAQMSSWDGRTPPALLFAATGSARRWSELRWNALRSFPSNRPCQRENRRPKRFRSRERKSTRDQPPLRQDPPWRALSPASPVFALSEMTCP